MFVLDCLRPAQFEESHWKQSLARTRPSDGCMGGMILGAPVHQSVLCLSAVRSSGVCLQRGLNTLLGAEWTKDGRTKINYLIIIDLQKYYKFK